MDASLRQCACVAMVGMLSLSACAAAPPANEGPTVRFVQPRGDGVRAEAVAPARVRRDGYGRPIHFREQRLDHHGVMRDVVPRPPEERDDVRGRDAGCDDQGHGRVDDGLR